jgi:plastocyanin
MAAVPRILAAVPRILASVPRILIVVPGILAGIFVPALLVTTPKPAPPNTVGMNFMDFSKDVVTLHVGERLTLVNSSRNIHAIGPGQNGQIVSPVRGEPLAGYHMMETNAVYTTGPWLIPGTYYVTCSIHPMMNLTVVVLR